MRRLRDLLTKLFKLIAKRAGQSAWVAISKCSPPIDKSLLVWCRADLYPSGQVHQNAQMYIARFTPQGAKQNRAGECLVTHWRHLSSKPADIRGRTLSRHEHSRERRRNKLAMKDWAGTTMAYAGDLWAAPKSW